MAHKDLLSLKCAQSRRLGYRNMSSHCEFFSQHLPRLPALMTRLGESLFSPLSPAATSTTVRAMSTLRRDPDWCSNLSVSLTWSRFFHIMHSVIPLEFNLYPPVPFVSRVLRTFQSSFLSLPIEPFKYSVKVSPKHLPICITDFQSCLNEWFQLWYMKGHLSMWLSGQQLSHD